MSIIRPLPYGFLREGFFASYYFWLGAQVDEEERRCERHVVPVSNPLSADGRGNCYIFSEASMKGMVEQRPSSV